MDGLDKNNVKDLINIGAYKKGSNPEIDYAVSKIAAVNEFLQQERNSKYDFEDEINMLYSIFADQGPGSQ